jgi:hypothetical protein
MPLTEKELKQLRIIIPRLEYVWHNDGRWINCASVLSVIDGFAEDKIVEKSAEVPNEENSAIQSDMVNNNQSAVIGSDTIPCEPVSIPISDNMDSIPYRRNLIGRLVKYILKVLRKGK